MEHIYKEDGEYGRYEVELQQGDCIECGCSTPFHPLCLKHASASLGITVEKSPNNLGLFASQNLCKGAYLVPYLGHVFGIGEDLILSSAVVRPSRRSSSPYAFQGPHGVISQMGSHFHSQSTKMSVKFNHPRTIPKPSKNHPN